MFGGRRAMCPRMVAHRRGLADTHGTQQTRVCRSGGGLPWGGCGRGISCRWTERRHRQHSRDLRDCDAAGSGLTAGKAGDRIRRRHYSRASADSGCFVGAGRRSGGGATPGIRIAGIARVGPCRTAAFNRARDEQLEPRQWRNGIATVGEQKCAERFVRSSAGRTLGAIEHACVDRGHVGTAPGGGT